MNEGPGKASVPVPAPAPEVVPSGAAWSALVSEPSTGVAVLSIDGVLLWSNDQMAKIFLGPDATAAAYVGKNIGELFPAEIVEERRALMQKVLATRTSTLVRVIWRGFQHMTWVHYIDPEGEEADPDFDPSHPPPARFLFITRRVASDEGSEDLAGKTYDVFESKFMDLGQLDVLTTRELEVMALIGQGLRTEEIAKVLFRSLKTINNHRDNIGKKLDAHDRLQLAELARRAGLTLRDAERTRV